MPYAGYTNINNYSGTNQIRGQIPRTHAGLIALTYYLDETLGTGAELTVDNRQWRKTESNPEEMVLNSREMKYSDLIPRWTPLEWSLTKTGRKALTSYQHNTHHPITRTTDTDILLGQKALTLYQNNRHWPNTKATDTDSTPGQQAPTYNQDERHQPHTRMTGTELKHGTKSDDCKLGRQAPT